MLAQEAYSATSFQCSESPLVFSEIFSPCISVTRWQRPENKVIETYFKTTSASLRLGIRNVFQVSRLNTDLTAVLPDGIGKAQAINDICLLAEMLAYLFTCKEVGLRLTAIDKAMCPRFHVDNIPVRLITTYLGSGTQWLPNELADNTKLGHAANGKADNESGLYSLEQSIERLNHFDVALLKGAAWGEDHPAAIHRSCAVEKDQWRVLLTLDPM